MMACFEFLRHHYQKKHYAMLCRYKHSISFPCSSSFINIEIKLLEDELYDMFVCNTDDSTVIHR